MLEPKQLIQNIGLNEKQAKVYLALLELGVETPAKIAQRADIKRPTAYVLLDELVEKGFVSRVEGKKKKFKAEHPDKLKFKLRENLATFERSLPWLLSLINKEKELPNVRFFKGVKEVQAAYKESLLIPNSELLSFGSAGTVLTKFEGFIEAYIKERVNRNIFCRAITDTNKVVEDMLPRDKKELRETRILDPWQFNQEVEIDIYGNKLTAISFEDNKFIAVILESKVIVEALRQMFEIIWGVARKVK